MIVLRKNGKIFKVLDKSERTAISKKPNQIKDGHEELELDRLRAKAVNVELEKAKENYKERFSSLYGPEHEALRDFFVTDIYPKLAAVDSVKEEAMEIVLHLADVRGDDPDAVQLLDPVQQAFAKILEVTKTNALISIIKFLSIRFNVDENIVIEMYTGAQGKPNAHNKKIVSELRQLSRLLRQQESEDKKSRMPYPSTRRSVNKSVDS